MIEKSKQDVIKEHALNCVLGGESTDETLEERARASHSIFVRSQDQLSLNSPKARGGLLIRPTDLLSALGEKEFLRIILEVEWYGSAIMIKDHNEPAATLRRRREELGLTHEVLARQLNITIDEIKDAEDPDTRTPMRVLIPLAYGLGLNPISLGLNV